MRDAFFHLNFLNARGILAQKIYNAHKFFVNFLTLKIGDNPNNQASSVSWLPVNPKALELAVLRKAYLIFHQMQLYCQ